MCDLCSLDIAGKLSFRINVLEQSIGCNPIEQRSCVPLMNYPGDSG